MQNFCAIVQTNFSCQLKISTEMQEKIWLDRVDGKMSRFWRYTPDFEETKFVEIPIAWDNICQL